MPFTFQEPETEVTEGGAFDGETTTRHPAYAQIGAQRVSGRTFLYGSDFKHNAYISIMFHYSENHRLLSYDRYSATKRFLEVAMSEAQWATFVSSLNIGGGVPCTIQWRETEGWVPQIPAPAEKKDQFSRELGDHFKLVNDALAEAKAKVRRSGLSGKKQDDLISSIETAERNLAPNLQFVADQFGEHMETTVEKAKMEINAYVQTQGEQFLAAGSSPILLIDEPKDLTPSTD